MKKAWLKDVLKDAKKDWNSMPNWANKNKRFDFKCDICGRFVSLKDLESGKAVRKVISVDSDWSVEDYETICKKHYGN
jgi:hypothetical protein